MNRNHVFWGAVAVTVVAELITIGCRVLLGQSAAEFNQTDPPLILQIHHMFWSVPLIGLGLLGLVFKWKTEWIWALVIGLIASDLLHHFVVLPLWVGNTGWHWP